MRRHVDFMLMLACALATLLTTTAALGLAVIGPKGMNAYLRILAFFLCGIGGYPLTGVFFFWAREVLRSPIYNQDPEYSSYR